MSDRSNRWLKIPRAAPDAALRLFCFPYAGAGASAFQSWPQFFPPQIEVGLVQLPGREDRLREPPFWSMNELLRALIPALEPALDRPFAFFGHSLGALIGFECARRLRERGFPAPLHLFVSARGAPRIPPRIPPRHTLDDARFIKELRKLEGTPEAVLANPELMEMLLPIFRADFAVNDTYIYRSEAPLIAPIDAFGGQSDSIVEVEDLKAWEDETSGSFRLEMIPGSHFFLHQSANRVPIAIAAALRKAAAGARSLQA